jgi:hypothetical protein
VSGQDRDAIVQHDTVDPVQHRKSAWSKSKPPESTALKQRDIVLVAILIEQRDHLGAGEQPVGDFTVCPATVIASPR